MNSLAVNWLKSLIKRDDGVTATEYALIAALVAVVIVAVVTVVGTELNATFMSVADEMQTPNPNN